MRTKLAASTLLLGLLLSTTAFADPLPTATPESVGLSPERLGRITEFCAATSPRAPFPAPCC